MLKPEERAGVPEVGVGLALGQDEQEHGQRRHAGRDGGAVRRGQPAPLLAVRRAVRGDRAVDRQGHRGAHRFVNRVWRLWTELRPHYRPDWRETAMAGRSESLRRSELAGWARRAQLRRKLHQTIRKVGEDIENFRFNTAVAALMEFTNELSRLPQRAGATPPSRRADGADLRNPGDAAAADLADHAASGGRVLGEAGQNGFTCGRPWPAFDPAAAAEEELTIVVQVNGKVRDRLLGAGRYAPGGDRAAGAGERQSPGRTDRQTDPQSDPGSRQTRQYRHRLTTAAPCRRGKGTALGEPAEPAQAGSLHCLRGTFPFRTEVRRACGAAAGIRSGRRAEYRVRTSRR